jgi:hypothetical protein
MVYDSTDFRKFCLVEETKTHDGRRVALVIICTVLGAAKSYPSRAFPVAYVAADTEAEAEVEAEAEITRRLHEDRGLYHCGYRAFPITFDDARTEGPWIPRRIAMTRAGRLQSGLSACR